MRPSRQSSSIARNVTTIIATVASPLNSAGNSKNFPGVTGSITIGAERNAIGKKLIIEEIRNGQLTLKATVEPQDNGAAGAATATTATTGSAGATATTGTH